jgi:hypothetical protein
VASTKSSEPAKEKVKLLKPEEMLEVILGTDRDEMEDDSSERAEMEEDYEFHESDQSIVETRASTFIE